MTLPSLRDLAMLARLTRDFPGFIRTPITSEQAVEIIRGRLAAREERFLRMAEERSLVTSGARTTSSCVQPDANSAT
jgi:hypothetical protein